MAKGFKHGTSGGVGGVVALNFTVQAYPSEVELNTAVASENTIGIVTTEPINGWFFSATQPEDVVEGAVWIATGEASNVAFNALNRNEIQVYPVSAKQFVSGEWVDKTAKSYHGGAWVDWWEGELYEQGNQYIGITGGWNIVGYGSKSDTSMRVGSTTAHATNTPDALVTANAIDFSDYATIEAHFITYYPDSGVSYLDVDLVNESGSVVATAKQTAKASDFTLSIQIPADCGKCRVQIKCGHASNVRATYADFDHVRAVK